MCDFFWGDMNKCLLAPIEHQQQLKEKIPFKFNLVARGVYWGYL